MVRNQFLPEPLEPCLQPFGLDGLKRNSVNSRSAVILLGQPIGFAQRLQLADMHVQSPEPPGRFGLRLAVYPPPQVLQTDGCLCHLTPTSRVVGGCTDSRVPLLGGHYSASSLVRTPPPPSPLRPLSRLRRLYRLPCSTAFAMGGGGLLQLLSASLSPCCRYHPAGVEYRINQSAPLDVVFASPLWARPPGPLTFGATYAFACA